MKHKNRFFFKGCPRCQGDIYLDRDVYGVFTKCLQCGRIYEAAAPQLGSVKARSGKLAA